ncbi:hypothetical protein Cgig2_002647 [Carnegiea gigantea]|uniref:Uncharacterized protein n=1 Tax=Carnegiea gigantea TaxID=171969 RepID=A0A9Q1GMZ0_9CARY|nr:hypothetical protein Cgig2_002647 [Carnegiea gigantea]
MLVFEYAIFPFLEVRELEIREPIVKAFNETNEFEAYVDDAQALRIEKEAYAATKEELEYIRALTSTLLCVADIKVDDDILRDKLNDIIEEEDGTHGMYCPSRTMTCSHQLMLLKREHPATCKSQVNETTPPLRRGYGSPRRQNPSMTHTSSYVNAEDALGMGKRRMGIVYSSRKRLRKVSKQISE